MQLYKCISHELQFSCYPGVIAFILLDLRMAGFNGIVWRERGEGEGERKRRGERVRESVKG